MGWPYYLLGDVVGKRGLGRSGCRVKRQKSRQAEAGRWYTVVVMRHEAGEGDAQGGLGTRCPLAEGSHCPPTQLRVTGDLSVDMC